MDNFPKGLAHVSPVGAWGIGASAFKKSSEQAKDITTKVSGSSGVLKLCFVIYNTFML